MGVGCWVFVVCSEFFAKRIRHQYPYHLSTSPVYLCTAKVNLLGPRQPPGLLLRSAKTKPSHPRT
eukprot:scaffold22323_cov164-Skeletonema_dohrnii-CCMP3373.AAC.4